MADAEAEAANKAEERAKVWKTHNGSNSTSPNTTPNTSVEIVPKDAQPSSISQIDQASSSQTALPDVADGEVSDASCQCNAVTRLVFCGKDKAALHAQQFVESQTLRPLFQGPNTLVSGTKTSDSLTLCSCRHMLGTFFGRSVGSRDYAGASSSYLTFLFLDTGFEKQCM